MKLGRLIISAAVILLIAVVSLSVALGVALGAGWLMTLFLPLTLFEASLLALVAAIIVGGFWRNILKTVSGLDSEDYYYDDDEAEEDVYIPASTFYSGDKDKNWEAWVRYQLANDIYVEFQDAPRPVAPIGEKQTQNLAIRLADITIPLLKSKPSRVKQLKVTAANLKRQMNKMGQRPYDDDILDLAVIAINSSLNYNLPNISAVIHSNLWQTRCDLFDLSE